MSHFEWASVFYVNFSCIFLLYLGAIWLHTWTWRLGRTGDKQHTTMYLQRKVMDNGVHVPLEILYSFLYNLAIVVPLTGRV